MLKLIIFDMDGVLVDSEPAITHASIEALKEIGVDAKDKDFKEFTGMGDDKFIQGVAEKYGKIYDVKLKLRAYEVYTARKDSVKVFPKAKKLIQNINNIGLKCAVASASDLVKVKINLARIKLGKSIKIITTDDSSQDVMKSGGQIRPLYVITGTDVRNKKPDPEIFLKAAQTAGIDPEYCLVIEDAVSGVQAAKAAGMKCIGVTTSFNRRTLLNAGADFVINKLYSAFDIIKNIKNN
ncbi:MAG: HAD family phosphatase [Oscillospiraceae bacterium]|nr:HAD family phosphatase [Oscillospiraceae bacterium]